MHQTSAEIAGLVLLKSTRRGAMNMNNPILPQSQELPECPDGMFRCERCDLCKNEAEFKNSDGIRNTLGLCMDCLKIRYAITSLLTSGVASRRKKRGETPDGMAYCVKCETYKEQSRFSKRSGTRDKLNSYCKDCVNLYYASTKDRSRIRMRERNLNHKFGIGEVKYQEMFESQGGLCAICGEVETKLSKGVLCTLTVDHDHETGRIRGLLCAACNLGLGSFRDKLENLATAIDYLMETHR